MLVFENQYNISDLQTDISGWLTEGMLFFDIETTGLSPARHQIYCIGTGWYEDGSIQIRQYLSDRIDDEPELLSAFSADCRRFQSLVTFNGAMFDLPFVRKRCEKAGMEDPFSGMDVLDLFRAIRPVKNLLGLENQKQKTVETFLGLTRDDTMSGGELIPYYFLYVKYHRESDLRLLLLHNLEDVRGMFELLALLSYQALFDMDYEIRSAAFSPDHSSLAVEAACSVLFPAPAARTSFSGSLRVDKDLVYLQLPVQSGSLRHYFKDYKNYYYLPEENTVIHKSVGIYVDPDHRTAATVENCFLEKECTYLTLPKASSFCFYQKNRKDKWSYLDLSEVLEDGSLPADPKRLALLSEFICLAIRQIITEK